MIRCITLYSRRQFTETFKEDSNNIHLMYGPEGNSQFCFPERSDQAGGKTKLTSFPRDHTLSVLLYIQTFIQQKQTNKDFVRATTAQLYPGRDTFEFDQGHVNKNQPITVLILLSESLAIFFTHNSILRSLCLGLMTSIMHFVRLTVKIVQFLMANGLTLGLFYPSETLLI